jgi:hypothetical protein
VTRLDVSHLVYGPQGRIVVAAFVMHIASLLALGAARRSVRIPMLIAAAGMVILTVFSTDLPGEDSVSGTLHIIGATLSFGGVAVAAWLQRRNLPLVALSLLVVLNTIVIAGFAQEGAGVFPVAERLQLVLNGAWIINVALATD